MTVPDHPFQMRNDAQQRATRSCQRCGRVPEVHPPAPVSGARNLDLERELFDQAGRLVHLEVDRFADFAAARAGTGPIRDHQMRDWFRELREELGDGGNYGVWGAIDLIGDDRPGAQIAQHHLMRAVANLVAAWEELRVAEGALR